MKKTIRASFIASMFAIAFSNMATAQKLNAAKVPQTVKAAFSKAFPTAGSVKWEMENNNYEAGFKQDGKSMSAVMDAKGAVLETETDIKVAELPKAVADYLTVHYKGAKVKEAAIIKKASGEINYEAEVNGKDVLFNSKGEFIKEVKD
jgi:hypothetical protein